jgi:hypothetical protein
MMLRVTAKSGALGVLVAILAAVCLMTIGMRMGLKAAQNATRPAAASIGPQLAGSDEILAERDLIIPVEGVAREPAQQFRGRARQAQARGARHHGGARHAGVRGGRRARGKLFNGAAGS